MTETLRNRDLRLCEVGIRSKQKMSYPERSVEARAGEKGRGAGILSGRASLVCAPRTRER